MTMTTPYSAPDIAAAVARGQATAADGPYPALDAGLTSAYEVALWLHSTAQKYAGMAQDFRASAWEHLEQGDLPQASDKAWGLVAETVKAVIARYSGVIYTHYTHRAIVAVIDQLGQLADAAGDAETRRRINDSFHVARSLRINFYENELPDTIVRDGLEACEELSDLLYQLFWPGGLPAPTDTLQ